MRINEIAQSLAGASGIYGFAGITCASAALSDAAANTLAGRAKQIEGSSGPETGCSSTSRQTKLGRVLAKSVL